jgi:hypothetical protein
MAMSGNAREIIAMNEQRIMEVSQRGKLCVGYQVSGVETMPVKELQEALNLVTFRMRLQRP